MNPELRFKDQDGNDFPDWEEKKLKNICIFVNGKGHEQVISQYGKYIVVNSKFVSTDGEIVKYSNEQLKPLFKDDIVMVMSDVPNGRAIAKFFYIDEDNKYSLNQRICAIRTNQNQMFIMKQLNRHKYFLAFDDGAKQTNLKKEDVLKCPVFIPDIEEQSKIATLLSDIDKKIESQATLVEKLKNTKDAMLVKMFPQGESKVPEIRFDGFSGDWKKIDVRYLINEAIIEKPMDGNHGEKHPVSSEYVEDGIPFLMASDVKDGKVDLDNCKFISKSRAEKLDKGFARNNDVLLTHKATIGETAILTGLNTEYAMLTPQVTYYRIIDNKKLNHFYLYSAFMSKQFQKDIHIAATQSTRSYIGIVKQHKLKIWFPIDIQEQEKIGQFFSNLDKEIEINQQKYEKLCDVKKALLSKLFPTKEDE